MNQNNHKIDATNTKVRKFHVDIKYVKNDILDFDKLISEDHNYKEAIFITEEDGNYYCGSEVEKMSKSKFNVVNPDQIIEQYGADTFRMYEMFLGPVEQSKPWDTNGIDGVHRFLKKLWIELKLLSRLHDSYQDWQIEHGAFFF